MARHQVLTGLPAYGPPAEPFTAGGHGAHREGFVVGFADMEGRRWVGNFQPGLGGVDTAVDHPDGRRLIVIAGGQGYVVDPEDPSYRDFFGGQIEVVLPLPNPGLLLGNGLWFEAIGPEGLLWRSDRISWDGMRSLKITGPNLSGEAWDPLSDSWVPFALDLITGRSRGGSYEGWTARQLTPP